MDLESSELLAFEANRSSLIARNYPIGKIVKDRVSDTVSYIGFAVRPDASEASAVWKICLIQKVGTITTVRWAQVTGTPTNEFNFVWDLRTTYFVPPAPAFSNAISTFFDGVNDRIELAADPVEYNFERTQARSWAGWVKFSALGAVTRTIIARHSGNRGWRFHYEGTTQRLRLVLMNAAANHITAQCDTAIVAGQWYHLAWTYNGSSDISGVTIYINGVAQPITTISNNLTGTIIASTSHRTNFGARGSVGSESDFLAGHMDEHAFYQVALTGAEISAIYNAGDPPDLAGLASYANLICWWRLGDGDTYPTVLCTKSGFIGTMQNMVAGNFVGDVP